MYISLIKLSQLDNLYYLRYRAKNHSRFIPNFTFNQINHVIIYINNKYIKKDNFYNKIYLICG